MANHSREIPLVRYTMGMVLLIITLALVVLGTIIYQHLRYGQISERAHDFHLHAAATSGDALTNLAWIRTLLVTGPSGSYARARDLITYEHLVAERIEELLALESAHGFGHNRPLVERLQQQWNALQADTDRLAENQARGVHAFRQHGPALELTLHQLQRLHTIAHDDLIAELACERRTGARTLGVVLVGALITGVAFGAQIIRLIRQALDRRQRIELALADYRDQLEDKVAARTSELEASNKELEAFSYSVSHDLRAPLRAIDGFSHSLVENYSDALDATGKKYLERIRNGAQRMGKLIDDMLSLSRISRVPFRPAAVDAAPIARDIFVNLRSSAPGRDVQVDIAESLPCWADVGLLRIALENLFSNAWKYTSKTPHARIRFDAENRDDERVFRVSDNGVGFDMDLSDKLFEPFQRLHGNEEFEGTGIGLATVARIIRRHGGRVWADGEIDKGATFYFTLGAASGAA